MIVAEQFWQITSNGRKQLWVYEAEKAPNGNVFHMGESQTHTHTNPASMQHSFSSSPMHPINNHLENDNYLLQFFF